MTRPTLLRSYGPLPTLLAALGAYAATGSEAGAQDVAWCEAVHRFLTEDMGMVAETSPDTVHDATTREILTGCRVTAAGGAFRTRAGEEAEALFDRVLAAGWTRAPYPGDASNDTALRFRRDGTDCFFSVYLGLMIGSEAEMRVNVGFRTRPGEDRYNVVVQCVQTMPAVP